MKEIPGLEIIEKKVRARLEDRQQALSLDDLKKSLVPRVPKNLNEVFLNDQINIIAEIKRASPSEGDIQPNANPVKVAELYLNAKAKGLSVLTETDFFKGQIDFISQIRKSFPDSFLLMKDFILDEYQILEGVRAGADAVLLIAGLLGRKKLGELVSKCSDWGLIPLVEVHEKSEMTVALELGSSFIGVNNRNLKTMKIDVKTSAELAPMVPSNVVLVSESGLKEGRQLADLKDLGYTAFLMGTHFMKDANPGEALKRILKEAHDHES